MDRRTALLAFPGVLTAIAAIAATDKALPSRRAFERCYRCYVDARAVADAYLESDLGDEHGFEIFDRLRIAAKALILEPSPDLESLSRKLNCHYTEEMYLGTLFGKEAAYTLANDGRRLLGEPELEPLEFNDCDYASEPDSDRGDIPEDPGFSADEFAERKFREVVDRYPDSWRLQSFCDYERINADLYAAYTFSLDRRFISYAGVRMESAMDDHGAKCWGIGKHGGDAGKGFAHCTVLFFAAESFEPVKDQFRVNA